MSNTSDTPAGVDLLREFINTRNIEAGTDRLGSAAAAESWLLEHGLVGEGEATPEADLPRLTRLRENLRSLTLQNAGHEGGTSAEGAITDLGRQARLVVEYHEGRPALVPAEPGIDGAIAILLAQLHDAVVSGEWQRLKACGNDACQWAYYDRSRNGSRRWCDSQSCGNLMAARAYRHRQRQSRSDAG